MDGIKASYLGHLGDDLTIVNAARVSFHKESDWEVNPYTQDKENQTLKHGDKKLIKFLASNNHWTPFSHPQIMMREKVPIFVARQRFKHMVGFTYNEVSRRYVDDAPEFFTPDEWRARPDGSVKQGSGEGLAENYELHGEVQRQYAMAVDQCERAYEFMIESGVAPEQARMVLPQSMYTEYYVTGSLAAWARAYKQRIDPHSQFEIQQLAKSWNEIIRPLFSISWAALID